MFFKNVIFYLLLIFFLFLFGCNNSKVTSESSDTGLNEIVDNDIKEIKEEEEEILEDTADENWEEHLFNSEKEDENFKKNKKIIILSGQTINKKEKDIKDINFNTLSSPKECLKYTWSLDRKRECILYLENRILNDIPSIENCKKLILKKDKLKCLDKLYFTLAKKKKKKEYCNFIKDLSIKNICIRDINHYFKSIALVKEKQNIQKQIDKDITSVSDCNSLKGEYRAECFIKLVQKEKDLRYCANLTGTLKNKCINDNWTDLLKYNLLQAVKTKDPIYCKKIYEKNWVSRCLAKIDQ